MYFIIILIHLKYGVVFGLWAYQQRVSVVLSSLISSLCSLVKKVNLRGKNGRGGPATVGAEGLHGMYHVYGFLGVVIEGAAKYV